jgi:hypothetical protein
LQVEGFFKTKLPSTGGRLDRYARGASFQPATTLDQKRQSPWRANDGFSLPITSLLMALQSVLHDYAQAWRLIDFIDTTKEYEQEADEETQAGRCGEGGRHLCKIPLMGGGKFEL